MCTLYFMLLDPVRALIFLNWNVSVFHTSLYAPSYQIHDVGLVDIISLITFLVLAILKKI